ncbi:MAG: ABC transporter permease [Anaerolineaceae bacterium]
MPDHKTLLRPRWQKVISDLWRNKTRSLLIVASISVGLLAFGVITNLYFWLNQDMGRGFEQINPASIQFKTSLLDHDMLTHIQKVTGVKTVEGAREFSMQILSPGGIWNPIELQSKNFDMAQIGKVKLEQGVAIPGKNQIVLSDHKLSDLGVKVGDWVTLQNSAGDKFSLQVVGIVQDQMIGAANEAGGFFTADAQGYISKPTLSTLHIPLPDLVNQLYITISGDATQPAVLSEVGERVYQSLDDNGVTIANYSTRSPLNHPNIDLINAIVGILFMLTFLIIFLSGFLITNTLQFLLTQQMQQVGIMKSIGATRRQIVLIYVGLISAFGALAFFAISPLIRLLTDRLMVFLSVELNFTYFGPRTNPVVLFGLIFLAMVVPQIAASQPILKGTRLSVQEALSGIQQQAHIAKSKFDTFLTQLKGISRPNLIAIRSVFRNKGRLILTLVTLSLGGAVFISVFNVQVSFTNYITQLSHYFLADLNISLAAPARIQRVEQLLYTNPEIKYVEAWSGARATAINADGSTGEAISFIAAPNNTTLIDPIVVSGRWLLPSDENAIVLSDGFQLIYPGVKIGDPVTLMVNGKKESFMVVGFFQLAGKLSGFASYVNQDYFSRLPGQVQNQSAVYRAVAKDTLNGTQQKALAVKVQAMLEANNFQISSISTGSRINEAASSGFSVLTTFLLVLAILIALVGSIGLTGTMSMNIMERTREIGIMRSIGASDQVLTRMVLIEGLIIGWLSWALGAVLSFPISSLMSNGITLALFGAPSTLKFSISGFLIWFVVVSILSILASILPARNATRLTIREVLAYE